MLPLSFRFVLAFAISLALHASGADAACSAPPAPAPTIAPGPAPDGNRLPIDAGPLLFRVDGAAIHPVTGTDGLDHLAFSAVVTNASSHPVTIAAVETLDASTGLAYGATRVVSMGGSDLARQVFLFSKPAGTDDGSFSPTLPPGGAGSLYLDVAMPQGTELPAHLALRLASAMAVDGGRIIPYTTTGVPTPVSCEPPVVLSPPLKGSGWINGNGCCRIVSSHRWVLLPIRGRAQRPEQFAIDFVKADESGRLYAGDPTDPRSWFGYDSEVVAAAAGTVVEVVDELPDEVPMKTPPLTDVGLAAGNHVIADLGSQRYALYAHLKPGSVAVKAGDKIASGQRLGHVGNSGNTDSPHLHFQVMDAPSALDATGLPFVLERMTLAGRSLETGDAVVDALMAGKAFQFDRSVAGPRTAMPLMLDILDFQ